MKLSRRRFVECVSVAWASSSAANVLLPIIQSVMTHPSRQEPERIGSVSTAKMLLLPNRRHDLGDQSAQEHHSRQKKKRLRKARVGQEVEKNQRSEVAVVAREVEVEDNP